MPFHDLTSTVLVLFVLCTGRFHLFLSWECAADEIFMSKPGGLLPLGPFSSVFISIALGLGHACGENTQPGCGGTWM